MKSPKRSFFSPSASYKWPLLALLPLAVLGCSDVRFSQKTGDPSRLGDIPPPTFGEPPDQVGGPGDGSGGGRTLDPNDPPPSFGPPNFGDGIFDFVSAVNRANVWIASNTASNSLTVSHITLDEEGLYPVKSWSTPSAPQLGNRTYVTEVGLFVGKQGGVIYRVDPDWPTDREVQKVWEIPDARSRTRTCLTSFRNLAGQSFLGVAWENNSNQRMFSRIPLDPASPTGLNLEAIESVNIGGESRHGNAYWSYGCFTDRERGFFWGGWNSNTSFFGINLNTLTALEPSTHAPNRGHVNEDLASVFDDPGLGRDRSYALSGDNSGNIISGPGLYTAVHDSRHDLVYMTTFSSSRLRVVRRACFVNRARCAEGVDWVEVNMSDVGRGGPLSTLNDGRVIMVVRGNSSQVYVLRPNQPSDLSQGIGATRIAEVPGNAYMYYDFTGGSLYSRDIDLAVDLSQIKGFQAGRPVTALYFSWLAQAGGPSAWQGLTLEARCYSAGQTPGDFAAVQPVANAGQVTSLQVPSCINQAVNRLDLRLRGSSSGTDFTRTNQIRISGVQ